MEICMSSLYRFGVSLEKDLIEQFDEHIKDSSYTNRSEAIRDLIRDELIRKQWKCNNIVAGAITMVYDHHKHDLLNKIVDLQHDHQEVIIATQHVHLDHHNCLEILAVRGKAREVTDLSNKLKAVRGILHVSLNMSATGKHIN